MEEDICLHALNTNCEVYKSQKNLQTLVDVLSTGALLSKRKRHYTRSEGFNGLDYISLCDYQKRMLYMKRFPASNAYESYIKHYLSLMFPKDKLDIIEPTIVDIEEPGLKYYEIISALGMSKEKRYSDMPDEVQVKDMVSLDLMCGLTFPLKRIKFPFYSPEMTSKVLIRDLKKLKAILLTYGYDVPIFDIDSMEELRDGETVKKLIYKYN